MRVSTYIKYFCLYLILEKILWLSPILIYIVLGSLFLFLRIPEPLAVFLPIIILPFLVLVIYKYFQHKKVNLFQYIKLTTRPNSKKAILITAGIFTGYIVYFYLINLPLVKETLGIKTHVVSDSVFLYLATIFLLAAWEEICARGIVLTRLTKKMGFNSANLMSAAIFTASHYFLSGGSADQTNLLFTLTSLTLVSVTLRFILGYTAGLIMHKSNSLWPAIILHFSHNAIGTIFI